MARSASAAALAVAVILIGVYSMHASHRRTGDIRCADCNVLLVSVDALRPDHLGVYGYGRSTSRNIDRLAAGSLVFDNAVTPRPKTNPSVSSLMSGLYPYRHGVRDPLVPMPRMRTLPAVLREKGFTTAAFVSNWLLQPKYSGLDGYFDLYDFDFTRPELNRANFFERNAEETNEKVLRWLDGIGARRFFLWVHYFDPHGPYYPPPAYRYRFTGESHDMVRESKIMTYQILPDAPVEVRNGDRYADAQYYRDQYDDEVYYADEQIGRLLAELDRLNLERKTLVILTSDHGEGLGEHDYYFEHGREIYEDNSRIPLIVRFPSGAAVGRSKGLVSIMDIYPTVLDFIGASVSEAGDIDGVSFLPLAQGGGEVRPDVFIERHEFAPYFERAGVRTRDMMLIMNGECDPNSILDACKTTPYECYDLASDPLELNPSGCGAAAFDSLRGSLDRYIGLARAKGRTAERAVPSRDVGVLKSLGYLH